MTAQAEAVQARQGLDHLQITAQARWRLQKLIQYCPPAADELDSCLFFFFTQPAFDSICQQQLGKIYQCPV